jgi:hypothetical protein
MDKIRGRILIALLMAITALAAIAQSTINYGAGPGLRDVTYGVPALPVPDGNQVRIGYFNPGFNVSGNSGNIFALASAFHELDSATNQTIFGQPGRFSDSVSTTDPSFDNQKICLWLFKTTDNGAPLGNYSNVEGYGLYSSTALNWLFPVHDLLPPPNATITSSEINQAYYGNFDPFHLVLAPVPEPSTYTIGGVALAFFVGSVLRKRFKKD